MPLPLMFPMNPWFSLARNEERSLMHVRSTKPIKLTTPKGAVVLKPHHVVELPDTLARRLLAKVPQIRKVRSK